MRLSAFVSTTALFCIPLMFGQQSRSSDIHDVSIHAQTGIDALLSLGQLYNRPLGIVGSDKSILAPTLSVQVSQAQFADVLARVMSQLSKYEAHEVQGVVLIQPLNRDVATERLFTMVLPNFDSETKATLTELADLLWMDVELRVDPSIRGFAGIRHETDFKEFQPIHLVDVTVEDVLNELVRRRRSAAWVGFSAPEVLTGVQRERLWSIVSYEDPPVPVENLCCLNRTSLSAAQSK